MACSSLLKFVLAMDQYYCLTTVDVTEQVTIAAIYPVQVLIFVLSGNNPVGNLVDSNFLLLNCNEQLIKIQMSVNLKKKM